MFVFARTIVILLLLALPLQVATAAGGMLCAGHVPLGQGNPTTHQATVQDHHGSRAVAGESGQADEAAGPSSGLATDDAAHPSPSSGTCAYCATCCACAALVNWTAQPTGPWPDDEDFLAERAASCSQPFDGPERPPRTF